METLEKFGIQIPLILLPSAIDLKTWAVIACDQYTQNRDYWEKTEQIVGKNPSTLHLMLPEIYLDAPDKIARIERIHSTMKEYITDGIFAPEKKGFVYIERKTSYGRIRHGLIMTIDLETYEWKPGNNALIRSTEETIVERLPPRMDIRRGAPLETPHIMLLTNDPGHLLVEQIGKKVKTSGKKPIYSGDLMQNGGSITGWLIENDQEIISVKKAVEEIAKENKAEDGSLFLFAAGDGNHSLATAKAVWDEYKNEMQQNGASQKEISTCPVRYALVEVVNIYDSGLTFEPIHRVLFHAQPEKLIAFLQKHLGGIVTESDTPKRLEQTVHNSTASFGFVYKIKDKQVYKCLETPVTDLAVSRLQPLLDTYIEKERIAGTPIAIDYIHGCAEVFSLGSQNDTISILLPPIAKDSFFATIHEHGPLPRKSFSMGEANEKRFYLECRKLFE